jgi:hypothetical protein
MHIGAHQIAHTDFHHIKRRPEIKSTAYPHEVAHVAYGSPQANWTNSRKEIVKKWVEFEGLEGLEVLGHVHSLAGEGQRMKFLPGNVVWVLIAIRNATYFRLVNQGTLGRPWQDVLQASEICGKDYSDRGEWWKFTHQAEKVVLRGKALG